jgi:hypothetical protein
MNYTVCLNYARSFWKCRHVCDSVHVVYGYLPTFFKCNPPPGMLLTPTYHIVCSNSHVHTVLYT